MALPVTITGIALNVATVGPYKSSGGNFYFFGKDASTATTLQCYKAIDPTDAWSSVATQAGFSGLIREIFGYQEEDIVHLLVVDGASSHFNYKYVTFNMATDTFVISETAVSDINVGGPTSCLGSIIVRSDGQPVILYQGPMADVTFYWRVCYTLRTGTNTWAAPVEVDDAAAVNYYYPVAILGISDAVQFVYGSSDGYGHQRTLSAANSLQDSVATGSYSGHFTEGISYLVGGILKCLAAPYDSSTLIYFDAGDTPVLNLVTLAGSTNLPSSRLFSRGEIGYLLYSKTNGGNKDYCYKSTDDGGAHWSVETYICSATNNGDLVNTSRFGRTHPDLYDVVMPFFYSDTTNTELKHNRKAVSTTLLQGTASLVGNGMFNSSAVGGDFTAPLEDPFRLRFSIVNEGDALDAAPWQLYVSKNGGVYHAVTTTSDDAYSLNAGTSPDETPIFIPRLTAPA